MRSGQKSTGQLNVGTPCVLVRVWVWVWVWVVGRSQWVVWFAGVGGFGFGLGLGVGVARVLLVGQTVPDQLMLVPPPVKKLEDRWSLGV